MKETNKKKTFSVFPSNFASLPFRLVPIHRVQHCDHSLTNNYRLNSTQHINLLLNLWLLKWNKMESASFYSPCQPCGWCVPGFIFQSVIESLYIYIPIQMGKIIPLVSFGSASKLGSSGDPGLGCVTSILMGCPSHLRWLLLMQRSSGEHSDSLGLSQLLTHLLSLTWHLLPESSSCGSGLFQCHEVSAC